MESDIVNGESFGDETWKAEEARAAHERDVDELRVDKKKAAAREVAKEGRHVS